MADEPATSGSAVAEAPAAPFTLESAFAEASQADTTATPEAPAAPAPGATPDPPADSPPADPDEAQVPSDEKGSRREQGRQLREQIEREVETKYAQREAQRQTEQQATAQRQQFEQLLTDANLPEDGSFETSQRRTAAQQKLGALYASNRVTQTAYDRGRADYEATFWNGFEGKLGGEVGLDDTGVRALMAEAKSGIDFAKRLVDHGKGQERTVWEAEVAKRDATIEQLRGQLAARTPSPEAANGLRTNGATSFDGTWEGALREAQSRHGTS